MSASKTDAEVAFVPKRGNSDDRGFTLVETLVALAVFAFAFAGIYRALDGGWQGLRRAQYEADAIEVARTQLAAIGIVTPLAAGRQSGVTADGVRWEIDIRERARDDRRGTDTVPRNPAFAVRVTAGRAPVGVGQAAEIVLESIKLGARTP